MLYLYILCIIIINISLILSFCKIFIIDNKNSVSPSPPGPPGPPGPPAPIKGKFLEKFRPGINLAGFDSGSELIGYSCISKKLIDYSFNSGFEVIRMPILPLRIINDINFLNSNNYNPNMFTEVWDSSEICSDNQPWNKGSYISALKYAIKKNMFVIIDVHDNSNHLCNYNHNIPLTKNQYSNLWLHISNYIKTNIKIKTENIIFELFNEPIPCSGKIDKNIYNDYQISAIKSIRKNLNNFIIVTTWGNWSGLHSWESDGSLEDLVKILRKNNITTKSNNILITGHQYCDSNFTGVGKAGCDKTKFNKEKWTKWLKYTDNILGDDFKWILTEGNVRCENIKCQNSDLYKDFIIDLSKTNSCCGYTLWMMTLGDSYDSAAMGINPKYIDIYKGTYTVNSSNYYKFPY